MEKSTAVAFRATAQKKAPKKEITIAAKDVDGDCTAIQEAINKAKSGLTINLIGPDLFKGHLVINKREITLVGHKDAAIISSKGDTIRFDADSGTVRSLGIAYDGIYRNYCPVNIVGGKLLLESCDIIGGYDMNIVRAQKNAEPIIRKNNIRGSSLGNGISIECASCLVEDNDIHSLGEAGIKIGQNVSPEVRGNKIYLCTTGISFEPGGGGAIEANNVFDNIIGIGLTEVANAVIKANVIYSNGCGMVSGHGDDPADEGLAVTPKTGQGGIRIARNQIHHNSQRGIDLPYWEDKFELMNRIFNNKTEICNGKCDGCVNNKPYICCSQGDFCYIPDKLPKL
ncbi:MAG: right-handed parallel beta-helix repeat-containing protein [Nitrospirota bacterium]